LDLLLKTIFNIKLIQNLNKKRQQLLNSNIKTNDLSIIRMKKKKFNLNLNELKTSSRSEPSLYQWYQTFWRKTCTHKELSRLRPLPQSLNL
jgi:hypothetical protein